MLNGHGLDGVQGIAKAPAPPRELPRVRIAGPADESEICRLLLLAHAENAIFPASNERVLWHVRRFLNTPYLPANDTGPRGIFGVIGPVGSLEGVVMVGLGMFWYTKQHHIEEYVVFVDPMYRSGATKHGQALIDWLKEQGQKTGLKVLTGIISNNRTEAKVRLYRRNFPQVGAYFFYDGTEVPHFESDSLTGPGSLVRDATP